MHNYVKRCFNCAERVHFISLDPDMLPLSPLEIPLFAGVTAGWTEMKEWAAGQEGGNRDFHESVLERRGIIRDIRKSMVDIAEMARSIELSGVDPGISERFRMPESRAYATVIASAQAFAEAAEAAKALFTARGMDATFVDDLEALIALFETSGGTRVSGLTRQTSGTAGLKSVADTAMKYVRQLRPIVRARLKDKPAMAAAWDLASRVEAAPTGSSGGGSGGSGSCGTTPPPSGSGSGS